MTTTNKDEEVVFEPNVPADDEFVVTPAAESEHEIKTAMNKLAVLEGEEPRYKLDDGVSEDVRVMSDILHKTKREYTAGINTSKVKSDGSTASYYELPENAKELQHLISFKDMNGQMAEIFRAVYRYGQVEHSEKLRDAKKIKYYIEAEIERLEKYESK